MAGKLKIKVGIRIIQKDSNEHVVCSGCEDVIYTTYAQQQIRIGNKGKWKDTGLTLCNACYDLFTEEKE